MRSTACQKFFIVIVSKKLPAKEKERLHLFKEMHAHAQYCMSGNISSSFR
jgi:hypothetical protein